MRSRSIAMRCTLAALLLVFTLATGPHVAQAAPGHTPVLPPCPSGLVQGATATIVRLVIDPQADCFGQSRIFRGFVLTAVRVFLAWAWATVIAATRYLIRILYSEEQIS